MSRSKKDEYPSNVSHKHLDLTGTSDDIAQDLKGIKAEYVFFAAYLAKDDEKEATQINGGSCFSRCTSIKRSTC